MTREEELIELLDKETITDDAIFCDHPLSHGMQEQRSTIEKTFREFGLQGRIIHAYCAPQVNCFDFSIGANEKPSTYRSFKADIQMAVGKSEMRMLFPEPGKYNGRLEIANSHRAVVAAGEMFRSAEWRDSHATLPVMMGKDINGNTVILDLAIAPHLLMAGTTGSGKTVFMDSCIHSLMFRYTPCELKLVLVDCKVVEFSKYNDMPYLQFPVINSTKDTLRALQWLIMEMERRYKVLSEAGCRDIRTLNEQRPCSLPYIVTIINEFSDLMAEARKQMELLLSRLCAKSRAVGIHLVISTQRPDARVLTGGIRANFPTRIAFRMASHLDSRKLLDVDDAAYLLGQGDMLFRGPGAGELMRIQGVYVNAQESARILECLNSMYGDMQPKALAPAHGMNSTPFFSFHDKLVGLIRDILEARLDCIKDDVVDEITGEIAASIMEQLEDKLDCLKEEIIDDACDEIADSLVEHWDELQVQEATCEGDDEAEGNRAGGMDSTDEEAPSDEDRELLLKAIQVVIESRRPSTSYIQRMLKIGYNKASALLEVMERHGIVSPQQNWAKSTVLVKT